MDVRKQIDAVGRTVELDGTGGDAAVTLTRDYDAPIGDLWDACTNIERIPRWFMPVTGDLRDGGTYQLESNAGGRVLSCDPPNSFRLTWEYGGESSDVEVRLTALSDGRTRFALTHFAPINDFWAQYGPGATGIGWETGLLGLGPYLVSGADVTSETEGWDRTEEARRFMELSGRLWGEAHAAAGADPEEARASAERTVAFFTAEPGA
ncbi:SRPBCC family protein [Nocardiopsis sp. HUAS JQ3]|uniref:SRPBCC family protein n=1 Tax=Nocardiopsis sp. HUAS JQ3 TaxID=3061629 RepID=UPI0023A97328|nr:SRPBCC family protein [Nocardiopsis sp. HUAS JQ3]WDZ90243.1 SRPBCC family protein [Nocardiopsis sp. HUAS JQ3]